MNGKQLGSSPQVKLGPESYPPSPESRENTPLIRLREDRIVYPGNRASLLDCLYYFDLEVRGGFSVLLQDFIQRDNFSSFGNVLLFLLYSVAPVPSLPAVGEENSLIEPLVVVVVVVACENASNVFLSGHEIKEMGVFERHTRVLSPDALDFVVVGEVFEFMQSYVQKDVSGHSGVLLLLLFLVPADLSLGKTSVSVEEVVASNGLSVHDPEHIGGLFRLEETFDFEGEVGEAGEEVGVAGFVRQEQVQLLFVNYFKNPVVGLLNALSVGLVVLIFFALLFLHQDLGVVVPQTHRPGHMGVFHHRVKSLPTSPENFLGALHTVSGKNVSSHDDQVWIGLLDEQPHGLLSEVVVLDGGDFESGVRSEVRTEVEV